MTTTLPEHSAPADVLDFDPLGEEWDEFAAETPSLVPGHVAAPVAADDEPAPEVTLQQRFEAFHEANPWVYDRMRAMALRLAENGHRRVGVKMLWETIRFHTMLRTIGSDPWKLNNSFTSRYARLLVEREPALAGVIETRELRS